MLRKLTFTILPLLLAMAVGANYSWAQDERFDDRDDDYRYMDRAKIDRYLDVDVWTNHADGEYYEGDNITIGFRASRDAFVAIYSIDTRGNVNMLFPSHPDENNFVKGGESYYLPGAYDDYDLVVSGPEGVENIQVLASRERFPIPDWYPQSGLQFDYGDRFEYMDYLNQQYFVRYGGQRFAYDRTSIYVNEWEPTYFRPVHAPYYPSWTVTGNVYLDYGWGHSVYINGVYWGCTPLYIPRIYVGWHTVTVYDRYGYCWERDVHITHYNTVVLDKTVISTSPTVKSKYKEVRVAGYQNPSQAGYKNYESKVASMKSVSKSTVSKSTTVTNGKTVTRSKTTAGEAVSDAVVPAGTKRYVRGTPTTVKTDRGIETVGAKDPYQARGKSSSTVDRSVRKSTTGGAPSYYDNRSSTRSKTAYDRGKSSSSSYRGKASTSSRSSSGYYQKKSGSSGNVYRGKSSTQSSSKSYRPAPRTSGKSVIQKRSAPSSKSSGSVKQAPAPKSSGSSKAKSSGSSKSSSKGKSKK